MSRGWAKASACRLQMTLSCAVLCHIVSLQYLSRSSLHRLAGLPCRLFLSYGLQVVTREVHPTSVVVEAVNMPCPGPFHFSHSVDYIYMSFVLSLTQMLVLLSLYVTLSILLSILICVAASLFCACLVSVQVSAPYVHLLYTMYFDRCNAQHLMFTYCTHCTLLVTCTALDVHLLYIMYFDRCNAQHLMFTSCTQCFRLSCTRQHTE